MTFAKLIFSFHQVDPRIDLGCRLGAILLLPLLAGLGLTSLLAQHLRNWDSRQETPPAMRMLLCDRIPTWTTCFGISGWREKATG